MLQTYIPRGNEIEFSATFTGADGDPVEPVTAMLYLSFIDQDGVRVSAAPIEMDVSTDGVWTALWDSSEADSGRVHWSAVATSPSARQDGHFELTANPANPDDVTA